MRERINRLAKGIIDMEAPVLSVQPEQINEEIASGGLEKKELYITSRNGLHIKGLAYSSNPRVRVLTGSFGGLRNHVFYEIDCEYLEYGDVIEGSFYLVTNSGEKEVPYLFSVQAGVSGKTLQGLCEVRDFTNMARRDYETAVRLFEYHDFVDVPFMQDIRTRTIYDGLLGHGNRYGQVEQFLIALNQKKPVELVVEEHRRQYRDLEHGQMDSIVLRSEGWGYLPVTVQLDGSFIQVEKKSFSNADFEDGVYEFAYQLSPGGLHGGKNFGKIIFETYGASVTVEIEAIQSVGQKKSVPAVNGQDQSQDTDDKLNTGEVTGFDASAHERLARYLSLRLEYESGNEDAATLQSGMIREAELLRYINGQSAELSLLQADLDLLCGRNSFAMEALEECRDQVIEGRLERPDLYCLYQYIYLQLVPDESKKQSLARLVRKYMEEGKGAYLLFYVFTRCEEYYCFENPGEFLTRMKVLYGEGCHSPFLYQKALAVFNDAPQLLYGMGPFETQVLHFGAKRGQVREELAIKAAKLAAISKHYQPLPCRVLKLLYRKYPSKEILAAICSLMIKGDCCTEQDFVWYEKALEEQVSMTRLYEYFIYSLPKDYGQMIPKEVLLYFSYDHNLDQNSRAVLYANIIRYMDKDSQLYHDYQREMGMFAAEQILQSRISKDLAAIYDAMLYPDMVDVPVAKVLPSILNSRRITCNDPKMSSVVVRYEELTEEAVYPLSHGVAYVPVFFDRSCILFQDAYGNRYADVSHLVLPVMEKGELEEKCFEIFPEHPMLLLGACRKAAVKEDIENEDILIIERALTQLKLHPLYRRELIGQMIRYYQEQSDKEQPEEVQLIPLKGDRSAGGFGLDGSPLLTVEQKVLSREQKAALCQTLIGYGYIKEAYKLFRRYFCRIPVRNLKTLCSRIILDQMFDQDEILVKLTFMVFEEGSADSVILDYLCENFNGSSEQMYRVLLQGVSEHAATYDLDERLLAQMMFSNTTDRIDRVFALYMSKKKTSESIIKAYFTMKSASYFLDGKPADESVFRYLESMIFRAQEKDKLSTIYLLALTKYYSGLPELDEEQKSLCQSMVDILLAEEMVFPHFKPLARYVRMPEDVMDKGILQYVSQRDARVELRVRIRPHEELFRNDDMKRVYQGIFIKQVVLFEGEVMEYRIYENREEGRVLMAEGTLECDRKVVQDRESRYQMLNRMALYMKLKEETGLQKAMQEYAKRTATVEELFGLM